MLIAPLVGFNSRKAAQIAAYFTALQQGMDKLKLIKLIYLSERECLARYSHPMLYDEFYSLKDGPICSSALNGINGGLEDRYWSDLVKLDRNGKNVTTPAGLSRELFDEVSDAEMEILTAIFERFKGMTASQIRKWTHENCPEYTEVERGRIPITYREILEAVGEENAEERERDIAYARRVASALSA